MTRKANCAVEPLLPVELGQGKIKFAQGVKADRWVFATGLMAQDFINGIAPDVLSENAPHSGLPKREKEALQISRPYCTLPAPIAPTLSALTSITLPSRPCRRISKFGANFSAAAFRLRRRSHSVGCCYQALI
jgi:hypothetical protein